MNIYYLGPKGSYSNIVAQNEFSDHQITASESFEDIIQSVLNQDNSVGILPIENSITSNVHENIDYIFKHSNIYIVGEAYLKIKLHLIGLKNSRKETIQKVYSHKKAIDQCSDYISRYNLAIEETESTAEGCNIIQTKNDFASTCIGSRLLVNNKLQIIAEDIGNEKNNYTRFIFISSANPDDVQSNKFTSIFKVKHEPGSLSKLLTELAAENMNLTKIESRPIPSTDFEYNFWIDCEIDPSQKEVVEKILAKWTEEYRIAGWYKRGTIYES